VGKKNSLAIARAASSPTEIDKGRAASKVKNHNPLLRKIRSHKKGKEEMSLREAGGGRITPERQEGRVWGLV